MVLARKRFGGLDQTKEAIRDTAGLPWIEVLVRDVRHGLRTLTRNPWFSLTIVLTMALALGANTAIFTVVNGLYLKDLPFEDPEEVAYIRTEWDVTHAGFRAMREQSRTMTVGAVIRRRADLSDRVAAPERVRAASISANGLALLGRHVALGRDFTLTDEAAGAEPVVLIGHRLWQRRYAGRADILGQSLRIDLREHTIIGVLPAGEDFPDRAELWVPLAPEGPLDRTIPNLDLFGRVHRDTSFEEAQAELDTIADRLTPEPPEAAEHARTVRSYH